MQSAACVTDRTSLECERVRIERYPRCVCSTCPNQKHTTQKPKFSHRLHFSSTLSGSLEPLFLNLHLSRSQSCMRPHRARRISAQVLQRVSKVSRRVSFPTLRAHFAHKYCKEFLPPNHLTVRRLPENYCDVKCLYSKLQTQYIQNKTADKN
jgi:hypothetical protein